MSSDDRQPVSKPKYPDIKVEIPVAAHSFAILAGVDKALRTAGVPKEERKTFSKEATAGDYNHLLAVVKKWVVVS